MSQPQSVVLHAVGDITLGDHPLCAGFGTHSRNRRRPPAFTLEHVMPLLERADLRFGNLECTLSEHGLQQNDYHSIQMRGQPGYLNGLVTSGFEVLNVANNHSMQHGPRPFTETAELLRGAGIKVCGVDDGKGSSIAATVVVKGLRIAFVGYSQRPRQYFTQRPLYAEGQKDGILADVRAARAAHDIVIVSLHWGDEFIQQPSPADVSLAHAIIDGGADLIIGHHPHVLRGVERYGRGWIVYSLGNFVCDMLWSETLRETAICECRLSTKGVERVLLLPMRINDESQPVPLVAEEATRLRSTLDRLSAALPRENDSIPEYEVAANLAHARERRRSHLYFLRNSYRFPPRILAAQLRTYFKNRMAERGVQIGSDS
jgi:poly-gamma-glutamate synthesis protein (capsule biosynthesis protein)